RDQADSPPPNEASAMWLKVQASSTRETFSSCGPISRSSGGSASLMHQVGVVREVRLVVLGRLEGVRGVVVVRTVPVGVEYVFEPADDGGVVGHDAQFPAQIECAAV